VKERSVQRHAAHPAPPALIGNLFSGFRFTSFHPNHSRCTKEGGGALIDATVSLPRRANRHLLALGAWARIRARTPTGAPPRLLHRRTNATAQPQAALPGTWLKDGCYPSPPVPV